MAKKQTQKKSALDKLDPRRQKYVANRAKGANKTKAALKAGFPESMARTAVRSIETPQVKEAFAEFQEAVRNKITITRCVDRLSEGLDATRLFVSGKGDEAYVETEPDFKERREYLKLSTQWGGYVPKEQADVVVPVQVNFGRL